MLTLTDNARAAVEDLTGQAGVPRGGGMRIAESASGDGTFELSLVPEPMPDDAVVDCGETAVFVESASVPAVDDLTLDADMVDGTGFRLLRD